MVGEGVVEDDVPLFDSLVPSIFGCTKNGEEPGTFFHMRDVKVDKLN